ncbi:TMEM175 family protein [Caulobacter sp. CCNWLY153]|uniref:TMEM175 family protein n=1 Tax=unclassified Caulobacter TaxID=2648921 RepID=UPI002FF051B5
MSKTEHAADDRHLHRLVLFSDAVFAIAITLLAIEIHPPEHWHGVADLFGQMGHKLWAYAVSFAVIGVYWISHRRIFARLRAANGVLDVLNLAALGLIGMLPLATELLWEHASGEATLVYVGLVAAIGVALSAVWGYAAFAGELAGPVHRGEALFTLARTAIAPGLMCGLILFSLNHVWGLIPLAAAIAAFVAGGRFMRRRAAGAAETTEEAAA